MTTKTNERPGTRAQVRYLRMSPSKVRVVLDLIRGKHVTEAAEILAYSERLAAREVTKVLRSAVANAAHNDEIPVQELYVSACYADEGPTLKRFRPRARGRAGRIAKRTCHMTIVVSRLSDDELDEMRSRAARSGATRDESAARRARVARSRGEDPTAETQGSENEEEATDVVADDSAPTADTVAETVTTDDVSAAEVDDAADPDTEDGATDESVDEVEVTADAEDAPSEAEPAPDADGANDSDEGDA